MWHPFFGFAGCVTAIGIFLVTWVVCRATKKHQAYNLGPGGDPRAYEPILSKYIRLSEFMIGLATGSIVLIIGSSAFHGQAGHLPWFYGSPLILIAASVIYGLLFMAVQLITWENVLHGEPHTASNYALNESLGYCSLLCFLVGYVWLVLCVTNF